MTRLEKIRRLNLFSALIDSAGALSLTWMSVKLTIWATTVGRGAAKLADTPIEGDFKQYEGFLSFLKAGGTVAGGIISAMLVIGAIIVFSTAMMLIVPAVFGIVSVRRAAKCEEPVRSKSIVRTADVVRLVFHTLMMIAVVILVIIAVYNSMFGLPAIIAIIVSTAPEALSIISLVMQSKMKGTSVNDEQEAVAGGTVS